MPQERACFANGPVRPPGTLLALPGLFPAQQMAFLATAELPVSNFTASLRPISYSYNRFNKLEGVKPAVGQLAPNPSHLNK
jgi:hypothetical protein